MLFFFHIVSHGTGGKKKTLSNAFHYLYLLYLFTFKNLNRVRDSFWQSSISVLEAILVTLEVHREVSHLLEEHASSIYRSLRLRYTSRTGEFRADPQFI